MLALPAGAAWLLRAHRRAPPSVGASSSVETRARQSVGRGAPAAASRRSAAALSGFAALVFEVSWTRLIALIIGPTTYAFALMAASFIVGIALRLENRRSPGANRRRLSQCGSASS